MNTAMNGYHTGVATVPPIEHTNLQADLDTWDDAIAMLNDALVDAATARLRLDQLHRTLEAVEASASLTIEGKNAEERRARLVLVLTDDHRRAETVTAIDVQRARLLDAERRVQVAKERTRLLRASLALHTNE